MGEVRAFILKEIGDKIHTREELEAKVRKQFSCPAANYILDLTVDGKLVQAGQFLIPFQEYVRAKENLSRTIREEGRVYLPLLKPNSAEQHIVEQMLDSGKLYNRGEGYASPTVCDAEENNIISVPELVYQFRKRGFADLTGCTDRRTIERFRRLVRDGSAKEFEGRYIHRKVYQELLIDAERSSGQDWIPKADALSQSYKLPYGLVAGIIPKK